MRKRRTLDEIADEAVEVIDPPAASREACHASLMDHIKMMSRARFGLLPTRRALTSLEDYAKALRAVKAKAAAVEAVFWLPARDQPSVSAAGEALGRAWRTPPTSSPFIDSLNDELKRVEQMCEPLRDHVNGLKGARPKDPRASAAAWEALGIIDRDCPWRRKPTLTAEGPWLRLSSLLYEASTGEDNRDLSRYCRKLMRSRRAFLRGRGSWRQPHIIQMVRAKT